MALLHHVARDDTHSEIFVLMFSALFLKFPRPLSSRSSYLLPAALRPRSLDPIRLANSFLSWNLHTYNQLSLSPIALRIILLFAVDFLWNIYLSFPLPIRSITTGRAMFSCCTYLFVPCILCSFCRRLCFTADLSWYTIALLILPSRFFPSLSDHDYGASDVSF